MRIDMRKKGIEEKKGKKKRERDMERSV